MDFIVKSGNLLQEAVELVALGVFEGSDVLTGSAAVLDGALGGQIRQLLDDGDFKGKAKELAVLYTAGRLPAKRVLLVGLGKESKISLEGVRSAAGVTAKRVRDLGVGSFTSEVFAAGHGGISVREAAQTMVEGAGLALYDFTYLKSEKSRNQPKVYDLTLVVDEAFQAEAGAGAAIGKALVEGITLTRDLVNLPGNYATPTYLAQKAQLVSSRFNLDCMVLNEEDMKELGMGALLGVASGTEEPARFIIMEYNAAKTDLDTIVLVGKGVTFDSGGISIKPGDGMERMTSDMAGGAAVIGAMRVIASLDLPLHVVALIPATENLPSGKAYKPGDVVRAMNGKTIQVISTDAEGRMLLADALCYAARYNPKAVVDIATLTGARMIALGEHAIGLFSLDDDLINRLSKAGIKTYERVWAMPMFEEYDDTLKSVTADFKHTGGKNGSSIIAARFLSKFISYPWAHLDVAGLVTTDTEKAYNPKGATGLGVRLLVQFLRDWAGK